MAPSPVDKQGRSKTGAKSGLFGRIWSRKRDQTTIPKEERSASSTAQSNTQNLSAANGATSTGISQSADHDNTDIVSFILHTACQSCVIAARNAGDVDIRPVVWSLLYEAYQKTSNKSAECCLLRALTGVVVKATISVNSDVGLYEQSVVIYAHSRPRNNPKPPELTVIKDFGRSSITHHRLLDPDRVDHVWIKASLEECERAHSYCSLALHATVNPVKILLIDIERRCLIEQTSDVKYFALSYVWGQVPQFRTTTLNIAQLKIENALDQIASQIPRTITDALEVAVLLGARYLWVDTFCVCQDAGAEKQEQISQMDRIYASACMTIIALSGETAGTGLPGISPRVKSATQYDVAPGVSLARRPLILSDTVKGAKYDTRAWTYQEQLLSRRRLYFTSEQVYFQCSTHIRREDSRQTSDVDRRDIIRTNPLSLLRGYESIVASGKWDKVFKYYAQVTYDYTQKNLSFQSDAVNAVSGILNLLQPRLDLTFRQGLPLQLIDLALLWVPMWETTRVQPTTLPSWSWAAWQGGVQYGIVIKQSTRSLLRSAELHIDGGFVCDLSRRVQQVLPSTSSSSSQQQQQHATTNYFQHLEDRNSLLSSGLSLQGQQQQCDMLRLGLRALSPSTFTISTKAEALPYRNRVEGHCEQASGGWSIVNYHAILDRKQQRCGLLYAKHGPDIWNASSHESAKQQLVLLSATKTNKGDFGFITYANTHPFRDNPDWVKVQDESDWVIYNFLLVSTTTGPAGGTGRSERLAIGQILASAWNDAGSTSVVIELV